MNKYKFIAAIDPDVEKSGFAELNTLKGDFESVTALTFPELIQQIESYKCLVDSSYIILVEAGWLNQSNWHLSPKDTKASAAAKGNSVGRNHETGRKIIEMAKHYGLNVEEVRPLSKFGWKAKDGKISHAELSYFIPGLPVKTNQEMRDACLIAWNYANFPIRVKPI